MRRGLLLNAPSTKLVSTPTCATATKTWIATVEYESDRKRWEYGRDVRYVETECDHFSLYGLNTAT
jgi:hypothetical protein